MNKAIDTSTNENALNFIIFNLEKIIKPHNFLKITIKYYCIQLLMNG